MRNGQITALYSTILKSAKIHGSTVSLIYNLENSRLGTKFLQNLEHITFLTAVCMLERGGLGEGGGGWGREVSMVNLKVKKELQLF